jgi:hypothetical protein
VKKIAPIKIDVGRSLVGDAFNENTYWYFLFRYEWIEHNLAFLGKIG